MDVQAFLGDDEASCKGTGSEPSVKFTEKPYNILLKCEV